MPLIVGFGGQKRNGKDAAADYLCQRLNELAIFGAWKRGSLGHSVKKIFAEHFGVTLEFIEEWKTIDHAPEGFNGTIRNGLTKIGDGWRDTKEDIWINKLFVGNTENLVISDVRYINETQACRGKSNYVYMNGHKGVTVLIWRPGYENDKQSRSEQELMPFVRQLKDEPSGIIDHSLFPDVPFDLWLKNDGTKEQWLEKIDTIVIPYMIDNLQ